VKTDYCWGHGIWNMPKNAQDNQGIGRGNPTENYPIVKATSKFGAWHDMSVLQMHGPLSTLYF
jgi:hypothetical protein